MKQPKLFRLFKTLDKQEVQQFALYVHSPYFNRDKRLGRFVDFLVQKWPKLEEVTDEKLYGLFRDQPDMNKQHLYEYMSRLLKLLEKFLAQQEYDSNPIHQNQNLLISMNGRSENEFFTKYFKKALNTLQSKDTKRSSDYLDVYLLEKGASAYLSKFRNSAFNEHLLTLNRNLDIFYLSTKLEKICEMINRGNIVKSDFNTHNIYPLKNYLENLGDQYLSHPLIGTRYQIFLTLIEDDVDEHYQKLIELLQEYQFQFSRKDAANMYSYAQNYCIRKINKGEPSYYEEIFKLYQILLDNELIFQDGYLQYENYKNITTVGLRLKRYPWVLDFLDKYKEKLPSNHRENAYNYNLASYYYERSMYKQAMKLLQQVEFTDPYIHLGAKSIMLKIYFELYDYDGLKYHLIAFQAYIKRNEKISRTHKELYKNLIKYVKKATNMRKRREKLSTEVYHEQIQELLTSIQQTRGIANKNWLKKEILGMKAEPQRA